MKPLERYSDWIRKTQPLEGLGVQVPVAPTGPKGSRPELSPGWQTGMAHPAAERAMVRSLGAWIERVVMPYRQQLTAPAQMAVDKELLILMHLGKGKSYDDLVKAADGMCDRVNADALVGGDLIRPSDLKRRFPELFPGGMGLRLDRMAPPAGGFAAAQQPVDAMHLFGRCAGKAVGPVPPCNAMRVHAKSALLFKLGAAGSAWTGICQMGRRSGRDEDIVYLVPNASVGSHMGFEHTPETKRDVKPGEHGLGGETSHSYACVRIRDSMGGFEIAPDQWNGRPFTDWFDPQSSGALWGFSMVKAFNILGHLYAWTSVSTNRFGSSTYFYDTREPDPTLTNDQFDALPPLEKLKAKQQKRFGSDVPTGVKKYGGETDVAVDWACKSGRPPRICNAGKGPGPGNPTSPLRGSGRTSPATTNRGTDSHAPWEMPVTKTPVAGQRP